MHCFSNNYKCNNNLKMFETVIIIKIESQLSSLCFRSFRSPSKMLSVYPDP